MFREVTPFFVSLLSNTQLIKVSMHGGTHIPTAHFLK